MGMRNAGLWIRRFASATVPFHPPVRLENFAHLKNLVNGADIYMLGTVHVSKTSVDEVKQLIRTLKPDTVAIELCPGRARTCFENDRERVEPLKRGVIREFLDYQGTVSEKVLHVIFQSFIKMLGDAGMELGQEFEVAGLEAFEVGAELHLIDQDTEVTKQNLCELFNLSLAFRLLRHFSRMKECDGLFEAVAKRDREAIDKLYTRQFAKEFVAVLQKSFPEVERVLISERDEFMTQMLRCCEGTTVAVVGLAHMDGIEQRWRAYEEYEQPAALSQVI